MFDERLLIARADSNTSQPLLQMLKKFRVPVGLSDQESKEFESYFETQRKQKSGFFKRWFSREQDASLGYLNDHSKCMYLMTPDNNFITFYSLEMSEQELADQLIEDISYDIGSRFVGTGNIPAPSK